MGAPDAVVVSDTGLNSGAARSDERRDRRRSACQGKDLLNRHVLAAIRWVILAANRGFLRSEKTEAIASIDTLAFGQTAKIDSHPLHTRPNHDLYCHDHL